MVPKPAIALSDDLLALFSRAEVASAQARSLLKENDRWRKSVLAQLDYMLELGTECTKPRRSPGAAKAFPSSGRPVPAQPQGGSGPPSLAGARHFQGRNQQN